MILLMILMSQKVVSSDGKRVRRRLPFTEKEKEELQVCLWYPKYGIAHDENNLFIANFMLSISQSRTVVVENLPEDHSYHNLEKIFSAAGRFVRTRLIITMLLSMLKSCKNLSVRLFLDSVKNIRICHPQESNSSRPKGDLFIRNKVLGMGLTNVIYLYI